MPETKQPTIREVKQSQDRRAIGAQQISKSQDDMFFGVQQNMRAEFDMWVWIYQEIANLRLELSRLGVLVRINNSGSPNFLEAYHSHIWSFLIPVSVIIKDDQWKKLETRWLNLREEINKFYNERKAIPNKKIPFKLIHDLDSMYRIALLMSQKAGLGFRISSDLDVDKALERAITGVG